MTALGQPWLSIYSNLHLSLADYLYARFLPSLVDTSYLSEVSRLVRGYSDVLVDDRIFQMNLLIPIPTAITHKPSYYQTKKTCTYEIYLVN